MNKIQIKRTLSKLVVFIGLEPFLLETRHWWQVKNKRKIKEKILKNGQVGLPINLTVELTYSCNLKCKMCYQDNYREKEKKEPFKKELSSSEWIDFLKKSRKYINRVGLTGGEVFIKKDVFNIMDCLEKLEIPFNIVTNGVLIDEKKAKRLTHYKYLDAICFSIHGPKNIHDRIVGIPGSFNKAIKAIKLLSGKHFWLSANCVIMEENINRLPQLINFISPVGIDSIGFQLKNFSSLKEIKLSQKMLKEKYMSGFINIEKDNYLYKFTLNNLIKIWRKMKQIARRKRLPITFSPSIFYFYPEFLYLGNIREKNLDLYCDDLNNCRINAEGNIVTCFSLPEIIGNIKNQPLIKIWSSLKFSNYRKKLIKSNLLPICNHCCKTCFLGNRRNKKS